MTIRLNIAKVAFGAFTIPWIYKVAFARALALPVLLSIGLSTVVCITRSYLQIGHVFVLVFTNGVASAIFVVACHRLMLLNPDAVASEPITQWFGRGVRIFIWTIAVWAIAVFLAALTTSFAARLFDTQSFMSSAGKTNWPKIVTLVVAFYVLGRLSPIFPAISTDVKCGLRWAWRLTKNNGWRLFLIVAGLPSIVSQLIQLLLREKPSAVEVFAFTVLGYWCFAIQIAAISLSYSELKKISENNKQMAS